MKKHKDKTPWHTILGQLLKLALEPAGATVVTDSTLLKESPRADIVIQRRDGDTWTIDQQKWLADGLRHTTAKHLLIEFKRSEGLSLSALEQLNSYDYYFRVVDIKREDVACFLVVASSPHGDWCQKLNFVKTNWAGVYQGLDVLSQRVQVILLNELADTPHNAPLKLFATKKQEHDKALAMCDRSGFAYISDAIWFTVAGLRELYMSKVMLRKKLTPEDVMAMGREWVDAVLKKTSPADYLRHHQTDEVLNFYKPDEVLSHYKADEVLSHYKPDEVFSHYKPDEVFSHYKPDEVLSHYKPDEVLSHYNEEEIQAYLTKLRQSKH